MRKRFFCVILYGILSFTGITFSCNQPLHYEITKISYYDDGICSLRYQHESNTERGVCITNNDLTHILEIYQGNNAQAITFSTQYQKDPIKNFRITSSILESKAPEGFFEQRAIQRVDVSNITPIFNEVPTSWTKILAGLGCCCVIMILALYNLYGNEFFMFTLG